MNPLLACVAVAAACWSAWLDLAARVDSVAAALPLVLVVGALAVPCFTGPAARRVPLLPLSLLLFSYAVAVLFAPPIFAIAPALLALCWILHAAGQNGAPRAPFYGLVLLALPVLSTLEFYTAYPVRLAAIEASATLLRMNGLAVDVEDLALRFGGQLIQFDAPCSGVRMLWTCAFLASALAYLYRFAAWRYVLSLALAAVLAVAGNILRATSLFYVESGVLDLGDSGRLHEAVGVVAFAFTALTLFVVLLPRARGLAA